LSLDVIRPRCHYYFIMEAQTTGGLMTRNEHIVIRSARTADEQAIAVLGVLDGGRDMPKGRVMVAEVDGRIRAAVGSNGASISDPFWPSAELVSMLRMHTTRVTLEHPARFFARRAAMRVAAGV
jgi:hypothetical protein